MDKNRRSKVSAETNVAIIECFFFSLGKLKKKPAHESLKKKNARVMNSKSDPFSFSSVTKCTNKVIQTISLKIKYAT